MISIFNDVVGPVMRGPSSSHCAAGLRTGRLARDLMGGEIDRVRVSYDAGGSFATTHETQGTDMGLFGGLLGWDAIDERLPDSAAAIRASGIEVEIAVAALGDRHPATIHVGLSGGGERHTMTALSTGGGMIEIVELDRFPVSLRGDCHVTLIRTDRGFALPRALSEGAPAGIDGVLLHEGEEEDLLEVRGQRFLEQCEIDLFCGSGKPRRVKRLAPVVPVLSRRNLRVPFTTVEEMRAFDDGRNLSLDELAIRYEAERGDFSPDEVVGRMTKIVRTVRRSIAAGLAGTEREDRILGHQCGRYRERMEDGRLLDGGMLDPITLAVTALMEVKSAMGVVVAAPTAGSCGAFPGACLAASDALGCDDGDAAKAMLAGGLIGVFIAYRTTFAAEVAGCQAECGAGSGMAAAALVSLSGGTTDEALAAASLALQNTLGLPCDPVANRVEVPCLGKNVMAAANALACANMALAGFDPVIPLDEVIGTMDAVGRSLPRELRCTGLGGLSITKASREIRERLDGSRGREDEP